MSTSDYEEDAYLGTIVTKTNLVTAVNNPPLSVSFRIAPNPVTDRILRFNVAVTEVLKSTYTIYQANGKYISAGVVSLASGTNYYSIVLPVFVSKGAYHIVINNKNWAATKTFVVL